MKFQIWYMKPEFFSDGIMGGKLPRPSELGLTHVHLKELDVAAVADETIERLLERVFQTMQAETWSPHGEARDLIESKGLKHTSMSVGDVAVDEAGHCYVVAMFGFVEFQKREPNNAKVV